MKARILAIALAAAAVASVTTPANALPGCVTYYPGAPRRVAQTGPDLVEGPFTMGNYCGDAYVVDLTMMTLLCDYTSCAFYPLARTSHAAPAFSENGFKVSTQCLDGEGTYRLDWLIRDTAGTVQAFGYTNEVDLTCTDDVPAGPGVQCPKYIYNLCRNIS